LINPNFSESGVQVEQVRGASPMFGFDLVVQTCTSEHDFARAFADMSAQGVEALFVGDDALFLSHRTELTRLAAQSRLPAIYPFGVFTAEGGLVSYGSDIADTYRRAGKYAGLILKGANPAELPVEQPTKFVLSINAKAAKALGLPVPEILLMIADEVIE
jgi:putative ABC transport system substrate-binding protein